jgi:hypothetical protein
VAGGNGLLALEEIAKAVGQHFEIPIAVLGFDTGLGMPEPSDFRDLRKYGERLLSNGYSRPAITTHQREAFSGRCRGSRSEDSRQRRHAPAWTLGLRLDYYSSTAQALRIIDGAATTRLPP